MKPAWSAELTLSIPMLQTGAGSVTPLFILQSSVVQLNFIAVHQKLTIYFGDHGLI